MCVSLEFEATERGITDWIIREPIDRIECHMIYRPWGCSKSESTTATSHPQDPVLRVCSMSKVSVTVIAPVLTNFFHCLHCEQLFHHSGISQKMHQGVLEEYPEDAKQEAAKLADLVFNLARQYGDKINLRVIDPQSLHGFFLSLRHWVRHYPTFIIDGHKAYIGEDYLGLERVLRDYVDENSMIKMTSYPGKSQDHVA